MLDIEEDFRNLLNYSMLRIYFFPMRILRIPANTHPLEEQEWSMDHTHFLRVQPNEGCAWAIFEQ